MSVNFLNLPGLDVVDFKETATEYHVRAKPKAVSRLCPHCDPIGKVVIGRIAAIGYLTGFGMKQLFKRLLWKTADRLANFCPIRTISSMVR